MAEARSRLEWAQTSLLAAICANPYRKDGTPPMLPADFDPHARTDRRPTPKAGIEALKGFLGGR